MRVIGSVLCFLKHSESEMERFIHLLKSLKVWWRLVIGAQSLFVQNQSWRDSIIALKPEKMTCHSRFSTEAIFMSIHVLGGQLATTPVDGLITSLIAFGIIFHAMNGEIGDACMMASDVILSSRNCAIF